MMKSRLFAFAFIFFTLCLPPMVLAEDINEIAYQNRFLLKAGTILNNEGKGDCLIFPYYDVRNDNGIRQVTEINIENFGEYGVAAKLRFREWARGREVFSTDIWIPSSGIWNGRIEINGDGTNAMITSSGNVIWRYDPNFFYFFNPLVEGAVFSKKNIRRKDSTLYGFVEVIGEERTAVEAIDGKTARLAKSEQDCPNTLRGSAVIRRVEDEAFMVYDAVAIGNFSRGQGSLFRAPGSPYPRLENCEDSLDQLEFQLSKWEIFGPYAVSPSNQGKTSLIVTFPTKFFHYKSGKRINQINNPFVTKSETKGETIRSTLSEGDQLLVDSPLDLPFSANVIGLYKDYYGGPVGIDNVSLPTYYLESGDVTLTSDNIAQRVLIQDYEYFQERFSMYRGLPATGLILREYRNPDQLHASIIPAEFSAIWEASDLESVLIPTILSGPTSGQTGVSYTFTTGGSASSLGHFLQYLIDWGDGTSSDWLDVDVLSSSKIWTSGGIYAVRARARCAFHAQVASNWSAPLLVTIVGEGISTPSTPVGPTFMVVNKDESYPFDKSYTFSTGGSISSLGHSVEYQFDWKGDGTDLSDWGPFIQPKTWTVGGTFTIRARARCATHTDVVSNWSSGLAVTVEAVSAPNVLNGPITGSANISYTYSTGGAVSTLGHQVQYFFDWGDGTNTGWLAAGVTTASKTWTTGIMAGYKVRTRARCVTNPLAVSDWTPELTVNIEFITAPTAPTGPTTGQPGVSYSYSTGGAFSSIGDQVQYFFDWGDNTNSGWLAVGVTSASKTWATGGDYSVRAMARCAIHTTAVSEWSDTLLVKIEKVTVSTPSGPATVQLNVENSYTFSAISNIGDPVQIRITWGDGSGSDWLPAPGGSITVPKSFSSPGTYPVTAVARCATHTSVQSAVSPPLLVTVNNAAPTLVSILPASGNRLEMLNVVITGNNFITGSTVNFGAAGITVNTTTVNSATQITANITIAGTAALGARNVSVTTPPPGGGTANLPNGFTVNNPVPTLTSILPTIGNRLQTLSVVFTGTNFVTGSSVSFGADIAVNTTVVNSATQITATITIGVGAALGPRDVSVTNAAPGGGGATLPGSFTVNNPAPTTTSISPTTATAGDPAFTLTVNGTNFVSTSVVQFDGSDRTTAFVSSTQLTADIPASDVAASGTFSITVFNPAPGGGTSNAQSFTVNP